MRSRIKNLEYYTTLSLLEKETANLFVADNDGLNRFKAGFFVDNFSGFKTQDSKYGIQNSIDREYGELRPKHYTTAVDLVHGPVVDTDATNDINFAEIEGNNVRKQANDIVSLTMQKNTYHKHLQLELKV